MTRAIKQKLPRGWTHERVRKLAEFYDNQSEDEQAAEHVSALKAEGNTVLVVPTEFVPEIVKLITKKRLSQQTNKRATDRSRSSRRRIRS